MKKKMTRITGRPFATPLLGAVPVQVRAHPGSENGYGHMRGAAASACSAP